MVRAAVALPAEKIADICRRYRVRELSIFGSALRDDFRPDSDVDLLVEFFPNHGHGLVEYLTLQEELGMLLGRKVDLVEKIGLKRFVRDTVLRSCQVIYAE